MPDFIEELKNTVIDLAQANYQYDDHSKHKERISNWLSNESNTKHLLIKPNRQFAQTYFKSNSGALFLTENKYNS